MGYISTPPGTGGGGGGVSSVSSPNGTITVTNPTTTVGVDVANPLTEGIGGYTPTAGTIAIQWTGNVNNFYQISLQNINSGSSSSTDFVATADNGTDSTHYVDMGINSSGGATSPFTAANAAYLYSTDNELDLGALGASGVINFYTTGGTGAPVLAGYFDASQVLHLTNHLLTAALPTNQIIRAPGISINGNGAVVATGAVGEITIPYAGTITNWSLSADQSGSCVLDIKRSASSIIGGGGNHPTLSSQQNATAAVSGWTSTSISAGDVLAYSVTSASTITRVTLTLSVNAS